MNVIDSANHLFRAHKLQYGANSNGSPEYIGIFMARECRSPVTHIHWYCSLSSARRAIALIRVQLASKVQLTSLERTNLTNQSSQRTTDLPCTWSHNPNVIL